MKLEFQNMNFPKMEKQCHLEQCQYLLSYIQFLIDCLKLKRTHLNVYRLLKSIIHFKLLCGFVVKIKMI